MYFDANVKERFTLIDIMVKPEKKPFVIAIIVAIAAAIIDLKVTTVTNFTIRMHLFHQMFSLCSWKRLLLDLMVFFLLRPCILRLN